MDSDGASVNRSLMFRASDVHYRLVILGLLFVLLANLFDLMLLKIDIDEAIANVGVLFFMVGGIQWLFDVSMRQQLYREITGLTIKNIRVGTSGISDVLESSRDVDYSSDIRQSSELIIGLNYTPRIIEDYIEEFRDRAGRGLITTIIMLDQKSQACEFISSVMEESGHIAPNLSKLNGMVRDLNSQHPGSIRTLSHSVVLRYSFVSSDSCIWIKPYRNSQGRTRVPAIQLVCGSVLHEYFRKDIESLIEQASIDEQQKT